jgi:hypothetical protein
LQTLEFLGIAPSEVVTPGGPRHEKANLYSQS